MTESKVDRNVIQDVIDSMIAHGPSYIEKLKELNIQFQVPYKIKDHVIRTYQPKA